jgi:exodeoxyribonuclease V gamma subunit
MLHVFHSNRMERLVDRLCGVIAEPLSEALAAEQFVVQNTGLARWLNLRLAEHFGIAANHALSLPASFVWGLFRQCLELVSETSPFDKEVLLWRVFQRLSDYRGNKGFASLNHYLADDRSGLKRYQLARRIADVFDQYLVYRPEWLLDWEAGGETHWQAQLWRDLNAEIDVPHRAALQQRFLATDLSDKPLPERVLVFGISTLAPMSLEVLRHLAHFTEVYFFILNPSFAYWGDILPERSLTRLRALGRRRGLPELSDYYETGNPLLASWGRLGRDFQRLLYRDNVPDEAEDFEEPGDGGLLHLIQGDLLALQDRTLAGVRRPVPTEDRSVQIHACHSPLREIEVVHDQLLALFQRHPDLEPRDVVVMTPDIERYAPYVQAVFGGAPEDRAIPWAISDLSARSESPLAELVVRVLDLPGSRFTASELLGLLEIPGVRRRFGIVAEDLPLVRRWVHDGGIRWGRDGAAKRALEQIPDDTNTWRFGFQRLFLGYALPEGVEQFAAIAPLDSVEGAAAAVLGGLKDFFDRLVALADLFAAPHSAAAWRTHLNHALDGLLDAGDDDPALDAIRSALDRLAGGAAEALLTAPLQRDVVKAFLQAELSAAGAQHRYAAGRVTFCAMVPMRAVPFRVVALLGLNDRDYPRRARRPSFDLMARDYRPGDRSPRDEDRHLFLEALLSARDYLLLSYVGAEVRDNSPQQPALMLSELMDYIEAGFQVSPPLVTHQPLQPFSRRYAVGEPGVFTYAAEWALDATGNGTQPAFCERQLPEPADALHTLELDQLLAFFDHPARYFLQHRLGVRLGDRDQTIEDDEPFVLAFSKLYRMRGEMLDVQIAGGEFYTRAELYRLRGELPRGVFADLALEDERATIESMGEQIRALEITPLPPLEVDLALGGTRLQGWLKGVTKQGLLTYRVTRFNGKDLIRLWLGHLVLNSLEGADLPRDSAHLDPEQKWELRPLESTALARRYLEDLMGLYREGRCRPLAFFPKTSYVFSSRLAETDNLESAFKGARKIWEGDSYGHRVGEGNDAWYQVAFRGAEPLSGEFVSLSRRIFGAALERLSE